MTRLLTRHPFASCKSLSDFVGRCRANIVNIRFASFFFLFSPVFCFYPTLLYTDCVYFVFRKISILRSSDICLLISSVRFHARQDVYPRLPKRELYYPPTRWSSSLRYFIGLEDLFSRIVRRRTPVIRTRFESK